MTKYNKDLISENIISLVDERLSDIKTRWYTEPQRTDITRAVFIEQAKDWFENSKINSITGFEYFPVVDVIQGCTQFFENIILKYGRDGVQTLPIEYAYYSLMGIYGTEPGKLEPNKPLLISLPHYTSGDIRPEWEDVLAECEQKNIDIHIDMAWIVKSRDISLDLSHPCIKSVGMSLSKLGMEWNRIGLRWAKQQEMDSITIANHYYKGSINTGAMACGSFFMQNIDRDYVWNTYREQHNEICQELELESTKFIHVARSKESGRIVCIRRLFTKPTPGNI